HSRIALRRLAGETQPGPQQIGPSFGRMDAVAGHLVGRADRRRSAPVKADAIAVALQRLGPALLVGSRDTAVQLAAERHAVDGDDAAALRVRGDDLTRVEAVARVEDALDAGEHRVEPVAEEIPSELAAITLAVLAPQQPAVTLNERHHLLGDGTQLLA